MTTTQTSSTASARSGLALAGVVTACAVACSLPLLAGAGVIASAAAVVTGAPWVGLTLAALVGMTTAAWWVRRSRRSASAAAASCECGGGCGG